MIWTNIVLVFITGALAIAAFVQWKAARDSADAAVKAAESAKASADLNAAALSTQREIERAYISMTHESVWSEGAPDGQGGRTNAPIAIGLSVSLRNSGRTPGTLLGGFVGYVISDEPVLPDITRATRLSSAFLFPGDALDFGIEIRATMEPRLTEAALATGSMRLWLVGQVDYSDRFGNLHTSGYGRMFHETVALGPGFKFSPETSALNFDRPMEKEKRVHYREAAFVEDL